mmetsp:Transcript_12752/g.12629  ORF Transcript_12752/g.12629 Transcript_12752/m.12629 type:complete len:204 (-) Transcript_12752:408-1019(-)
MADFGALAHILHFHLHDAGGLDLAQGAGRVVGSVHGVVVQAVELQQGRQHRLRKHLRIVQKILFSQGTAGNEEKPVFLEVLDLPLAPALDEPIQHTALQQLLIYRLQICVDSFQPESIFTELGQFLINYNLRALLEDREESFGIHVHKFVALSFAFDLLFLLGHVILCETVTMAGRQVPLQALEVGVTSGRGGSLLLVEHDLL